MRVAFVVLFAVCSVLAQSAVVPEPDAFFGRPFGTVFSRHDEVMRWVDAVDAASDRIATETYGITPEGRPLRLVVASSPENHARMEDIRAKLRALGDVRGGPQGADATALVKELPCVVWISFNVHGNEASGTEAFVAVCRRLAAADDAETRNWLDRSVVVMDPCLNPDGHARYVNWYRSVVGTTPDPDRASMEHVEPWPGGRFNHWCFDLNRDWAFASQPETRARLPRFTAWSPQVHADIHEMSPDSTYFFFPATKPVNANFPPMTVKWGRIFGEGNAAAFDAVGAPWYTGEDFDLFYPGYGDSWPSLNGAIGMTYEMAGNSRAGAAYRRDDGRVMTLLERLRHHERAVFATIGTAVSRREELLRDWHDFRRTAVEEGRGGAVRAFVLDAGKDPRRADALAANLRLQGIEVRRTTGPATLGRLKDVHGVDVKERTFAAGSYVVSLDQPLKRLAKTLLEPRTEIRELFFYDVSAWSLPIAFGVPCFESPEPVTVPTESVDTIVSRPGSVAAGASNVGWMLDAASSASMAAVAELLGKSVKIRVGTKPFTHGGKAHPRGAFLVRRHENGSDVEALVAAAAAASGADVVPVAGGLSLEGVDFGSTAFQLLNTPRVLLVGGRGRDATAFGSTRYLLDVVWKIPYSIVTEDALSARTLAGATAVVFSEGSGVTKAATKDALRAFMNDGGAVVLLGSAALGSVGKDGFVDAKVVSPERKAASRPVRFTEEREDLERRRQAPGAVFRVELDPAQPLAFGYDAEIVGFKGGLSAFDPAGPGVHVAWFADAPPIAGYVHDEDEKHLRGKSYITMVPTGDGAAVLFAEDPNFRGGWHALSRLFLNAVLLTPRKSAG